MSQYVNGVRSLVEHLSYEPGLQDSGDLEAATSNITAVAEPGAANYSSALTIAAPSDNRIVVTRLGVRLQVTIDSFGAAATTLNYRIKRGGVSIGTGTLATGASTGAKLVDHDVTSGTLTGEATYEVFLWADHADGVVVSLVQLWVGVGTGGADTNARCLRLDHSGFVTLSGYFARQGSGNFNYSIMAADASNSKNRLLGSTAAAADHNLSTPSGGGPALLLSPGSIYVNFLSATVTTDLVYVRDIGFTIRSEP